jgi:PAS domain S-box-containing protein
VRARPRRDRASRYRAILELAPDATVVTDHDGRISLVNRQTEALFGYARADLLGQPIEMLIPHRYHDAHLQYRADYLAAPHTRTIGSNRQVYGRRRDGSEFPAEVSISPLDQAGDFSVIGNIRDISERLRHGDARNDDARATAEAASDELHRLQALTDTVLSHLALDDLLRELLDRIHAVMDVDDVGILLLDAGGQQLTLRAALSLGGAVAAGATVPLGQGISGRVAVTRAPLIVDDVSTFDVFYPQLRERERSVVAVPIVIEDRLLGVIYLGSAAQRRFTEADVQLLQRAADRMALAIDRAHIYEAEQSARREAEAAQAAAERQAEQLDRIVEAMADGLVVWDAQGQVAWTNAAQRRMVGLDAAPPGFTRMSLHDRAALFQVRDPQDRPLSLEDMPVTRLLRGEELTGVHTVDVQLRALDGREVSLTISAAPLRDADGSIMGAVGIFRDQTERNRLEREREAAHASELALREVNERLDTFVAVAAHDLRSPVSVSRMVVQASRRQLLSVAAQMRRSNSKQIQAFAHVAETLETVEHNLDRLWRLVQQLTDVSRIRAGTLVLDRQPIQLTELVSACVEEQRLLAPTRTIALDLPDTLPVVVDADAERLSQVLSNFLNNADRYSPEDQPIAVALRVARATARKAARMVARVEVRDHGVGIPREEQDSIWARFQRARTESEAKGLGLGLYIARMIVELHGGEVGVKSAPGRGSTFWFTLPLAPAVP